MHLILYVFGNISSFKCKELSKNPSFFYKTQVVINMNTVIFIFLDFLLLSFTLSCG